MSPASIAAPSRSSTPGRLYRAQTLGWKTAATANSSTGSEVISRSGSSGWRPSSECRLQVEWITTSRRPPTAPSRAR